MMNVAERPNPLDDTIQEINPVLYSNIYTAVVILLVKSVSTVPAERSFSVMRRHDVHKNKKLDAERIIHQFSRLALTFHPNVWLAEHFL